MTYMSSYGTSHRFGRSVTNAIEPVVFHEIAERGIVSIGLRDWRRSSCENVPVVCSAQSACESPNSMSDKLWLALKISVQLQREAYL